MCKSTLHTTNDLAYTNLGGEGSTTKGCVEPIEVLILALDRKIKGAPMPLALVALSVFVIKVTAVFHYQEQKVS